MLGVREVSVLRGVAGEPLWPDGIVGSITHCPGFCAAAAAPSSIVLGLGIDVEVYDRFTWDIAAVVCLPEELEALQSVETEVQIATLARIFSAKESVYKCVYPWIERILNFHDIRIRLLPEQRFEAQIVGEMLANCGARHDKPTQAQTVPGRS